MANRTRRDPRQLQREKLLFRYTGALERGDFQTVAGVLREAERDPALAAMLRDLDDALAAELPVMPASSNHRNPVKETNHMVSTYPIRPQLQPRPVYPFTLAAAGLMVALVVGLLLFNRPTSPSGDATSAMIAQGATRTPTATDTFTASIASGNGTPASLPPPSAVPQGMTICDAIIALPDGANVFSAPDANAAIIVRMPGGASVQVVRGGADAAWYQVNANIESAWITGWLSAGSFRVLSNCAPIIAPGTLLPPTPPSPFAIGMEQGMVAMTGIDIANLFAGTPIQIISGYYDGTTWQYEIRAADGRMAYASLGELRPFMGATSFLMVPTCIYTIGPRDASLHLTPNAGSESLFIIGASTQINLGIITSITLEGGETWLLVAVDGATPQGWINQADLLNAELQCWLTGNDFTAPQQPVPVEGFPVPQILVVTVTPTPTHTYTPAWTPTP
jgi:hypothetical protein